MLMDETWTPESICGRYKSVPFPEKASGSRDIPGSIRCAGIRGAFYAVHFTTPSRVTECTAGASRGRVASAAADRSA